MLSEKPILEMKYPSNKWGYEGFNPARKNLMTIPIYRDNLTIQPQDIVSQAKIIRALWLYYEISKCPERQITAIYRPQGQKYAIISPDVAVQK